MELYDLLAQVIAVFQRLRIPYFVTGSLASMAYGEPRLTNDIDIVAQITEADIPGLLSAFPETEFYISEDAVRDAVQHRNQFNIIHPSSGLKVDVVIQKDSEFDRSRFSRTHIIRPVATYEAAFASPEDVIVKKMEYFMEGGSEKHLRDIASMLRISGDDLDMTYIEKWANTLGLVPVWSAIKERLRNP
jgi:hypothetical protein